jgi:hypothetical protein
MQPDAMLAAMSAAKPSPPSERRQVLIAKSPSCCKFAGKG